MTEASPRRTKRPDRDALLRVLEDAGTVTAAAELLDVPRQTVHRWMRELEINVTRGMKAA